MRRAYAAWAFALPLAGLLLTVPAATRAQSSRALPFLREAQQAMQSEDFAAAERLFRQAMAADSTSAEAACGLGQVHMTLREYEEAIGSLESCRRLLLERLRRLSAEQTASYARADQEIRELYETIGAVRSGRGPQSDPGLISRIENRIRELESLKTRDRVRVEAPAAISLALGTAYLQTGVLDSAERELLGALRSDPDSGEAHDTLATVYLAQGRFEEAAEQVGLAEARGARVSPQVKADIAGRHSPGVPSGAPIRQRRTTRAKDEQVSIQHVGRTCAADGVFVRVEATVAPSWGIHDPIVRFRSEEADGWYAMTMLPSGEDSFAATLPKPRGAKSFEYFIEVSGYDEKKTRTDDFQVKVVAKREECAEASADSNEPGGVLIVDAPRDVANAPPVPPGFSIRGTTHDIGVLEIGSNKALIAGGIVAAGAVAAGIAVASSPAEPYSGPEPFAEGPGIAFVSSNPPPGSTLSLSGGAISIELRVYSPETMVGARITAELTSAGWRYSSCIAVTTTQDLVAGRTESVVVSGPTQVHERCNPDVPIDLMRVRVTQSDGLGGFRTGISPLDHLRVVYYITE